MNKIIAIAGMTGSGKSVVADFLVHKGFQFLRMGQICLDIVKERGLEPIEENERPIRENLRKEHGMGAFAKLNIPKINKLLEKGNVVTDNLMSWAEYNEFEEKYKDNFICIAVYASPKTRYARLAGRKYDPDKDPEMRHRPASADQARIRDFKEIENIEKGGPIAMAHYTLINEGTKEDILKQCDELFQKILV
ncbi:MAG: AAA family ATPase [Nanoarchaeota archaeon]|nr:AAA family ATPase [Nanoarchaeota archaeon]